MKANIRKYIYIAIAFLAFAFAIHAQTNAPSITPQNIADFNEGVDSLIPLLPTAWKGYFVVFVVLVSFVGHVGRIIQGYRVGGILGAISGLTSGTNSPSQTGSYPPPPENPRRSLGSSAGLILFFLLPALLLTGCQSQLINNQVIHGFNAEAGVPIPYSGGQTLLFAKLQGGVIENNQISSPVSTNSLHVAGLTIVQSSAGKASVSASNGTNSPNAAIMDGQTDKNVISTESSGNLYTTNTTVNITH